MFGIAWSELLLIGVVALVVIPPKDLPTAMRTVGKWVGQMRRMAFDFQHQVTSALREAEFDDLKKSVTELTSQDIMSDIRTELEAVSAPVSHLEGQLRSDLSFESEIRSFPAHDELDMGMNALPTSSIETSTPPGNAHMPGAMQHEATIVTAEPSLEPIPVEVTRLPAHSRMPELEPMPDRVEAAERAESERESPKSARVSGV